MRDSHKSDHMSFANMVSRLREGRYVIPDSQRALNLPRLIYWQFSSWEGQGRNSEALSCEAIYGSEGDDGWTDIASDALQRLTAMYYALMASDKPAPNAATDSLLHQGRPLHG